MFLPAAHRPWNETPSAPTTLFDVETYASGDYAKKKQYEHYESSFKHMVRFNLTAQINPNPLAT